MSQENLPQVSGYIQRRHKKKLFSLWRRWYCVLSGRLLLFYKSESDYRGLSPFSDSIDLGLVYDVTPAPGLDFGIVVSTHTGPCWLRTRDQESHRTWLEVLQAAIIAKNQVNTAHGSDQVQPVSASKTTAPATIQIPSFSSDKKSGKSINKFFRLSLDLIPGHKYSTYDGRKLQDCNSSESIGHSASDNTPACDESQESAGTESIKKRKSVVKGNRPISGSVSDFLLMATNSELLKKSSSPCREKVRPPSVATGDESIRKKSPRLPTSSTVDKFLSLIKDNDGADDEMLPDVEETPVNLPVTEPSDSIDNPDKIEPQDAKQSSNIDCVTRTHDSKSTVHFKADLVEVQGEQCTSTQSVTNLDQPAVDDDTLCEKPNRVETKKPHSRRKSSLALIKQFFFPGKHSSRTDGETGEPNQNREDELPKKMGLFSKSRRSSISVSPIRKSAENNPQIKSGLPAAAEATCKGSRDDFNQSNNECHLPVREMAIPEKDCPDTVIEDLEKQIIPQHEPSDETKKEEDGEPQSEDKICIEDDHGVKDLETQMNEFCPTQESHLKPSDPIQEDKFDIRQPDVAKSYVQSQARTSGISVQEEPFIAVQADNYCTAVVLEVVEPPSDTSSGFEVIQNEELKPTVNSEARNYATADRESLLAAVASWLQSSPVATDRRSSGHSQSGESTDFAKHYSQPDLRPPLPIKTRSRCLPSPPYDIPRPISEPVMVHVNFQATEGTSVRSLAENDSKSPENEAGQCPVIQLEPDLSETKTSSEPSSDDPKVQIAPEEPKESKSPSETRSRQEGKISHLVNFFNSSSTDKQEVQFRNSPKNPLSPQRSNPNRISYASNEIIFVEEEIVKEF